MTKQGQQEKEKKCAGELKLWYAIPGAGYSLHLIGLNNRTGEKRKPRSSRVAARALQRPPHREIGGREPAQPIRNTKA